MLITVEPPLEISINLCDARQVTRLAIAARYLFKAIDGNYNSLPALNELRLALADLTPDPPPATGTGNIVDLTEEKLRLRRKVFKVLPDQSYQAAK